jgi:hypothetical protein
VKPPPPGSLNIDSEKQCGEQFAIPKERGLIYRITAGPPQGFGASRPRLCRALDPAGRDAGSGGVQPKYRKARMNIPEFATVLRAVMRHNMRLHDEGASIKDYLVPMAWGDPGGLSAPCVVRRSQPEHHALSIAN